MFEIIFIILCILFGYIAYKYAGFSRSDGSPLCRKNCDKCSIKCHILKK